MDLVTPLALDLRCARAAVFALVCVATTALGHTLMSGKPLAAWAIAAALLPTIVSAWQLTARRRGVVALTSATVAAQAALHTFFTAVQMPGAPAADPSALRMSMHHLGPHTMDMPAMNPGGTDPLGSAHPGLMAAGSHLSLGMVAAHLVAALICGLWLWRGESALFHLLRVLSARLLAPLERAGWILTVSGPHSRLRSPVLDSAPRPLQRINLRHSVSRRGPPCGQVFC